MENRQTALAEQQGVGQVRLCACGSVNLSLGTVTLHLDPGTFLRAAALLQLAAEEYLKQVKAPADEDAHPPALEPTHRRFIH